jgi:hypothetical protein
LPRTYTLLIAIWTSLIPVLYGTALDEGIAKIDSLYYHGQYQQTIEQVDNILQTAKNLPDSVLAKLYTYQAFSYVALDKKQPALNAFRYLLILNPKTELDPRFVSPKIIEIFEESKRIKGDSIRLIPLPFVPVDKTALLRKRVLHSLLYPGIGQISNESKIKGYILLGLETVSLIGLISSHFLVNSSHKKYLDARAQSEIDAQYKNYSMWYKIRAGFVISSAGIWGLNLLDAIFAK